MKGISTVVATILMLVITITLAGTAYMYIQGTLTTQMQGIEVLNSYCAGNTVTFEIRNIGTLNIASLNCTQTAPANNTTCDFTGTIITPPIAPGTTQTFTDSCTGTGSRTCQYRITPPVGRSVPVNVFCA